MGSTNFCRGTIIFLFILGITSWGLKAQPIADFSYTAPVPNCNPAVYSFTNLSTGVAPLSYQWNFGVYPGVNSVFQDPATTFLNCGDYTVQLIVTDGNGDMDTTTQDITVWCMPTANFTVDNVSGCIPMATTFSSSTSVAGSGTLTDYVWDYGDGFSDIGSSPSHTYIDEGCKQVTLIVTNSYGCVNDTTMSDVLCVYTPPEADFNSSATTSCSAPFVVNYQDSSFAGLSPYTYQWIFEGGDPATDTSANPTVTYNTAGSFSTTLIVTDVNGCTDTIVYDNYVVIANNTANITLNTDHGCPPLTVSAAGIASSTPIGWSWTVTPSGTITNSTTQTPSVSISDTGVFTLCLEVDFGGGCLAQNCTTITTHTPPNANYSIDGLLATCLRPNPVSFIDSSTGSNLSYAWSFPGGTPASANTSTPDTINYVACGTYSASLTVTDDFGCTDTYSTPSFLTITCPVADFTLDPSSGCIPLSVNFNSTTSTGNPVQWEWDFGDPASGGANTDNSQNPNHIYNTPGCYTVTLITTSAEGCKDTTVMPNAVCCSTPPDVAFIATPLINCANMPIYFTNQSTGTFPYSTYTWDFHGVPPYNNESNQQNPAYVYEDTGWFDVTLIVSNYGCNDTLTIDHYVHLLPPVANITYTRSCAQPFVINFNGSGSLGADTYTWVIPGGNPGVAFTPTVSVTYTTTGNHTVSLFVTNDSTGCTDNTSVTVTIRNVAAQFTGNPLLGCAPLTSCMSNTSVDAVSYAWLVTNSSGVTVATSTATAPCFSLTTPGVYSVRLIATDQFGCKDTLYRPSYITVWGPVVDFIGVPLVGCTPLLVIFTDLSTAPTSIISGWSWNFGDPTSGVNNTSTLQNPSHTYNNPGYYTVTLVATDDHGCTSTKTRTNYIHAIHPDASFILTDTTVCLGTTACFINTSTGTGLTYNWDFGNGITSTSSNPCYTYTVNGNYSIILIATDASGCIDTATYVDYVNVTHPTANLVADTTGSSCPPLAVHFTNLSVDAPVGSTYLWKFGDGQVSSAQNPSHIYNIAGTFDVTLIVTNPNGCKDTIVFNDYITIGGPQGYISLLPTSGCVPHYTCFQAVSSTTINFTWNFGDGTVTVNGDSICHTYTTTGSFYSELILNDGVGCVYALPIGVVEVNGANCAFNLDNPFLCQYGTVQFTDSSYGTSPVSQWDWNFGDMASGAQNTSSLQNPNHYFASPGTYVINLAITTVDGCTNSATDTVVVAEAPVTYFDRVDSSTCAPDSVHFFDQTISSSPIVSYFWNFDDPASGAANTDTLPNTVHFYSFPGTYNVTLTTVAVNGCSDTRTLPVYVHDTVIADAGPDQIICSGSSALLTASGGVQYSWTPATGLSNPNISSPIASPAVTTTYTVTVSNIYGCFDVDTTVVTVVPLPIISSLTHNNDTCGVDQAQAIVLASGGTPGYTYNWNSTPVQTNDTAINLYGNQSYNVIVTDANGCTVSSSVFITDLPGPNTTAYHTNTTCGNINGTAWVTTTSGNGGNLYVWNTGATNTTISPLAIGTYTVTVTDQFGCSNASNTTVSNTAGPTGTLAANPTTCSNNNSFVNLSLSGGTAPFQYNWNTGATTQDLTNQLAGTYSVTITDANGCTYTVSKTVTDMPSPSLSLSQVNATCQVNNGSIDVTVTNGTAPFIYNWNGNTYNTQDLTSIASGNYALTITDANGCTDAISTIINDTPVPSIAFTTTSSTCGNSNGSIDLTVTGGAAPYTYIWWNGETTEDLNSIPAGNYGITILGANGCTTDTIINLNDITAPTLSLTVTDNTCGLVNGSIDLSLSGGTLPFTYQWSGGETTQDVSNLAIGTYNVTVTDGNGCLAFANTTLINIPGSSLASVALNSTCGYLNGSVTLIVTGGTAPFNYSWNNSATTQNLTNVASGIYNVTVTDANLCTAIETSTVNNTDGPSITYTTQSSTCGNSNGAIDLTVTGGTAPYIIDWNSGAFTTEDISNLPSGNYDVTVTDQNGCTIGGTITLNNNAGPVLSATTSNPTCGYSNGSIDLTVTGGTSPINIDWNTGSYSTEDLDSLYPGTYTVVVTDSNNCSATISETLIDVAGPTASAVAVDVTCAANNGTITLTVTGGASPFSYLWSNGVTTQNLINLSTGIYSVTVIDANSCFTTASTIVSDVPGPFSSSATTSATCGNNNGSIDLSVVAGVAPYNYSWSNGGTTQDLTSLAIGWYFVTITDQNNCVLMDSAEVVNINGPSLSTSTVDETCASSNGQVYLTVSNGTSPYTYNWSNGNVTQDLNYVAAGTYTVTVTDNNGCTATASANFTNIPGPTSLSFGSQNSTCGNANGMAWVSVTGGTAPYSYHWNTTPVQSGDTAFNILGGSTYSVTVTDANLCTISGSVSLVNVAGPTYLIANTNCTCAEYNGAISLTTISGTAPFTYNWSNGEITEDIDSLQPGTYAVTITDANGCTVTASATVTNIFGPYLSYTSNNTTCGNNNGSIDLTVSGGTAPFFYDWNSGQFATQDLVNLAAGIYSIHLADAAGCQVDTVVSLTDIAGPTVTVTPQNSTCGYNNGEAVAVVAGGSAPFIYSWSNASIDSFALNLVAGNYFVTVTDTNGCASIDTAVVSNINGPSATATHIDATCGNNNASIDLVVIGGTSPFTYDWNTGTYTTQDITNLSEGTYFVVVTDSNNCQVIALQTVDSLPAPSLTSIITDAPCSTITGAIDVTVTGGTSPFNYNWSNGATTEDLNSLASGTYTLTFTDGSGCSLIDSFTVTGTIQPTLSLAATNANCGNAIGSINLTITNGTSPFTIAWSNGATTEDIDSLGAGLYVVHVVDSAGCSASDSAIIVQNFSPELTISSTNESCSGNDGTVSLDIVGGTFPLTFIWNNGAAIEDLTGLTIGTYYVTVTDANGCTAEAFADVMNTISPVISYSSINTYCGQSIGSIDVSVFGGSYPLNYLWSNGATTEDLFSLVAGTYTLTITDAANCVATQTITITDALPISIVDSIVQPSCLVTSSINLTLTGGMGSYSYLWSTGATTSFISGIIASNYQVTVTDSVGCVATGSYVINPQTSVSVALDSIITAGCNNTGAIFATVTGGAAPFNYSWNNGATTEDLTNLAPGSYDLTVTDSLGCIALLSATISNSTPPSTSIVAINSNCNLSNGSIDLTVTAGTMPYTYSWSNGSTTEDITSLNSGNYLVTVTDAVGCTIIDSALITNTPAATLAITSTAASCTQANGSVDLTIIGGTSPFTISWSNGATTEDLTGVLSGMYYVTVTDASGCSSNDSINVVENQGPEISIAPIDAGCSNNNGSIDLSISGGIFPFTFLWSNGATTEDLINLSAGNYIVVVTDANGCTANAVADIFSASSPSISVVSTSSSCNQSNGSTDLTVTGGASPYNFIWNNGQTIEDITNLLAGTYFVTVTDVAGCAVFDSAIIINTNGPIISSSLIQSSCGNANGSIDLTITGGSSPYNYFWNNGSTTQDLVSINAGSYFVTVTDATGCSVIDSFNITTSVSLTLTSTSVNASCGQSDGAIDLTIAGGISPFTILWSNGATTEDLNSVLAGNYSVTVIDASGCSVSDIISVSNSNGPTATTSTSNSSCGNNNGVVDVTVTGGTSPYTYNWNNGATTEDIDSLFVGNYQVTITDASGCNAYATAIVATTTAPNLILNSTSTNCNQSNGSINLTVTGGTASYNYTWSNGATTEDIASLISGNYIVTVTDSLGCYSIDSIAVNNLNGPTVSIIATQPSCVSAITYLDLNVSGGTGVYSYNWSNGATYQDIFSIPAGNYYVTVTDGAGCSVIDSATINSYSSPSIIIDTVINANCSTTGSFSVTVSGGTAPYNYNWSNGATTDDIINLIAGSYSLTVTDINGCEITTSASITSTLAPAISMTTVYAICNQSNGSIDLTVTGGVIPYSYNWNSGSTTQDINGVAAGSYTVTVTDLNNCFVIDSVFVGNTSGPIATDLIVQPSCTASTGSIDLTVTGGTAPYSFTWSNGSTSEDLNSIGGGFYDVTISDASGCQTFGSYLLVGIAPVSVTVNTVSPICNGDSVQLNAFGASTYSWSPNFGLSSTSGSNVWASPSVNMTYTVTGFNILGCFDTAMVVVTVRPVPAISATQTSSLICYGDSAKIVASGGTSYTWSPSTSLYFTSFTTAYAHPTSITTYTITGTNAFGCTSSTTIIVDVLPQFTMTVSSPDTELCYGESTTLIATGALNFTWSPATGLNATTGANITAAPTQTTTYYVTGINANGCDLTDSVIVIVHPPVVVSINPVNPTICIGSSITLTATGAVNYIWSPSPGLNTQIGSTVVATPTVTTTYIVTGTDSFGCVGFNAVIVTIGTSLTLYLNNNAPAICNGTSTTLVVNGAFNATYFWTPFVTFLDSTGMTVTVNPNLSSTYTVIATDNNGCTGTTTATVTVNNPPIINATNATACYGSSTALTVNGAVNYLWSPVAGLSSSTGANQIAAPDSTTTYTIIGTDLNGCADTTQSVFVVNPLPVLSATPSVTSICNGSSATITASGAISYQWIPSLGLSASNGSIVTAQPLVSTTYTIFGTDTTGCSNSVTAIVNVGAPVNIINTPLNPTLCLGDSLVISLAGASTYQWTPSTGLSATTGATVVATPLTSIVYTIIGTDTNGCTGSAIVNVTVYPNLIVNGTTASVCSGSSVTLTASGAYFYMWTPDPTLNSFYDSSVIATPVVNTTYTLTAMNMYGCVDTALFAVSINPLPVVNLDGLEPFYCVATTPDTLTGTPAGGILSGYGVTGNTFNPPSAGIGGPYLVTYTYIDSLGCSNIDTDTTQVGNTAMIIASSVNAIICNGSSAILNAMGGVTFIWSPSTGLSDTTGAAVTASPTTTTTYYVSGTNAAGCIGTDSIVVTVAPLIPLSISAVADSICLGSSTSLLVTGALTYTWSPSAQSSNINGDTVTVSPFITTTYTVTGVNAGGCSADTTVVINVLTQPVVTVNSPGVCAGDAALLVAQGASTYNWIAIGSTNDSVTVQPLVTTSYTVIGSVNFCSDTAIAVVSMLAAPVVSVNNDTICSGSSATLFANGASNYTWLPMNVNGNSVSVSPTVTSTYTLIGNNGSCVDTTLAIVVVNNSPIVSFNGLQPIYCSNNPLDTLVGIPAGGIFSGAGVNGNIFDPNSVSGNSTITYSFTDINGCSAADTQATVINDGAAVTVNPPLSTICNSSSAFITASGANTYTWSPSTGLNTTTGAQVEAMPASSITYTVTGISANGCSGQATAIVNIASNLVLSITATNDSICAGQTISITALGGTDYTWSPTTFLSSSTGSTVTATPSSNITYTVIATNAGGCSGQTSIPITMLPNPVVSVTNDTICAGQFATLVAKGATNYHWSTNALGNIISVNPMISTSYTVVGMNGACSDTATAFVSVNPLPVINAVSSGSFVCNGGTVQLDASGAITYLWSPSIGLNNTTGATVTASLTSSTTYTVSGIDLNGCANTQSVPVTVGLPVVITTNLTDTTICLGQSVVLNVGGANNFIWSPSTGLSSTIGNTVTASPSSTTTYTVTGTDINGCTAVILIIVRVNPIPTVTASSSSNSLCASSSATLTATGAVNYMWSPSIGLSSSTGSVVSAIPTSSIAYTVTGIDSFGCAASATVNIAVLPVPVITINSTNPTICLGASTTLSASGTNTYSWSPSINLSSTTNSSVTANPTVTTTYSVSAIDSNGCAATSTSVVTVQPLPVINVTALDSTLCFGHSTTLNASGAATYNWSPSIGLSSTSGNSVSANPSVNSTYTVTGTDAFGCQVINQIVVYIVPNPVINVTPNNPTICPGDFTTLVATGALNYLWSTNALGDSISINPTSNTSYTVTGTDANGCSAMDTALVTINSLPTLSAVSTQNNFCQGQTTVITASGGIDYTWYPAYGLNTTTGATVTAYPVSTTTYTIVGTNSNGCSNSTTIEITVYQLPMAAAGPDVDLCEGSNVQLNANGGTSYEWSPQNGLDNPYIANPNASPASSTSYIVNVGNQNGCHAMDTINITVHMKPSVNAGPSQTVCFPDTILLHGDGAAFYQWMPADYLNDSALQSPTCTPQFDITYTLTVSDSFGCAASDTVTVKVKRPFTINADPDISFCRNDYAQLNATGGFNYQWSPSTSLDNPFIPNPVASPSFTTTYTVYSSDGICFSSEDTVVVTVNQLPQAFAGADVELLYGSTYQLYGYTNIGSILWTPSDFLSCTTCADPTVNHLNTPMTYIFNVTDSMGCRAEDSVHISLTCNEDLIYVPNAFTPNGDNKNDEFRIRTYGLSQVKAFRVFNRWGEMVFESYDVSEGWDGTYKGEACAPAVFVYYLEGTCANGQTVLKQGNVTLIR